MSRDIREIIDEYWDCAYKQGFDRRDHDDEQGTAQALESELAATISSLEKQKEGCICQGCGEQYTLDVSVTDEIWEQIKPQNKPKGAGLLCPQCIVSRLIFFRLGKC